MIFYPVPKSHTEDPPMETQPVLCLDKIIRLIRAYCILQLDASKEHHRLLILT